MSPWVKFDTCFVKAVGKSQISVLFIDCHFSSHLEAAGKRSLQRLTCVSPLNPKQETTFQRRIPNILVTWPLACRDPLALSIPCTYWRLPQVTHCSTGWGFMNQAVFCKRCLRFLRPLRTELQLTLSNRAQPGILLCLSLLLSQTVGQWPIQSIDAQKCAV